MDAFQESAAPQAPLGYACFPCIVHERTHVQEYRAVFLRSPLLVQAGEPVARLTVGARLEERLARPASHRSVLLALVFKGTLLSASCCLWREDCFFVVLRGLTEGCGCSLVPSSLAVCGGSEHCFREPHWLTRFFPNSKNHTTRRTSSPACHSSWRRQGSRRSRALVGRHRLLQANRPRASLRRRCPEWIWTKGSRWGSPWVTCHAPRPYGNGPRTLEDPLWFSSSRMASSW